MENLFTPEEISEILNEAAEPHWQKANVLGIGSRKISIINVSPEQGLILAKGNEDTGRDHIYSRHRFGRQVWDQYDDKLESVSEFAPNTFPIYYIEIAGAIFNKENIKPDKNKRPELFNLYQGSHLHPDGQSYIYRLLTYKNTGIIHALYPIKSGNKAKILRKYKRARYEFKHSVMSRKIVFQIIYENKLGREVFRLIVRAIDGHPLERWYIQIGLNNSAPPQTVFILEREEPTYIEYGGIRHLMICDCSFPSMEKKALQILDGTFDYSEYPDLHTTLDRPPHLPGPTYFKW